MRPSGPVACAWLWSKGASLCIRSHTSSPRRWAVPAAGLHGAGCGRSPETWGPAVCKPCALQAPRSGEAAVPGRTLTRQPVVN